MKSHFGNPVRLAEPMVNKVLDVKYALSGQGIDLDIGDSFRRWDVQKEMHDKWVAGGRKGAKISEPDTSWHTIGYAFDLAQTHEMRQESVFRALENAGFMQHPDEWWHWSLEKI